MEKRYQDLIESQNKALALEKRTDKRLSHLRLLCAALILLAVILGFIQGFSRFIFAGIALAILLNLVLWIWQTKVEERCARLEGLTLVCQKYLDRISGDWSHFPDQGQEFADPLHPYSYDSGCLWKAVSLSISKCCGNFSWPLRLR